MKWPAWSCAANKLRVNASIDVTNTAIVLAAKRAGGKERRGAGGRGKPQELHAPTEPQIQEVLRIKEYARIISCK